MTAVVILLQGDVHYEIRINQINFKNMEYLLLGGTQNVGKSENIYYLVKDVLIQKKNFLVIEGVFPDIFQDFTVVLEGADKNGKMVKIIANTPTDDPISINRLKDVRDNNSNSDILISSVRDNGHWEREYFFEKMELFSNFIEVPLAKINRKRASFNIVLNWYQDTVRKLLTHVLELPPFNL